MKRFVFPPANTSPLALVFGAFIGLAVLAVILWVGFFLFLIIATTVAVLMAVNWLKIKITGRPLFGSKFGFNKYQQNQGSHQASQQGSVIEGELIAKDDDPK